MSHPDASFWDDRYMNDVRWQERRPPRQLVVSHLGLFPRNGLILDVASGTASTGIYLAERGWPVVALDVSYAALRLAQSWVREEALPISFAVMNLMDDPWLPPDHFDVILNFYFLSRPLIKTCRKSLKPGGMLLFETFLRDEDPGNLYGMYHHYLEQFELKDAFIDWKIVHYAETSRNDQSGRTRKIAQLVARKPY